MQLASKSSGECLCVYIALVDTQALQASDYSERQQVYVLVGEIIDTARDSISHGPLPYFVGVIAARSLLVLANPLHFMYIKVNRFLNKGPPWNVSKLPSYWIDKIMLHPPSDDDAHHHEVGWLLDALLDGLRTPSVGTHLLHCVEHADLALKGHESLPSLPCLRAVALAVRFTFTTSRVPGKDLASVVSLYLCRWERYSHHQSGYHKLDQLSSCSEAAG